MPSIITFRDVSFEFPNGRHLFGNLNFSLSNHLTALVGPNGIGKTTLAELILGLQAPTQGSIFRRASVGYFPQKESAPPLSVAEYLASDYSWSLIGVRLLEGIDLDQSCVRLSGGQWMRVRLAKALGSQFLVLDEPTNDLDREGREALKEFLRQKEGGALIISHDREILGLCSGVLELSSQGLESFAGDWSLYQEARRERNRLRARALEVAKKERDQAFKERKRKKDRQEKRSRRGAEVAGRGGMPKILLGARRRKAQVTTGQVETDTAEKAQVAVTQASEAFLNEKIDPLMYADLMGSPIPGQKLVAEAKNFNIRYENWIFTRDLNFSFRGNIRVAIKGKNGSGKSSLLRALLGEELETRGELRVGNLKTAYLDQKGSILSEDKNILENLKEVAHATEAEIRNGLARFLFASEQVFQSVSSLSGGERLRVSLAKALMSSEKTELLILDEPTNNLDLVNIEFLEDLLEGYKAALILISHDEIFLKKVQINQELVL